MADSRTRVIKPLASYDPESLGSLGDAYYPEFNVFVSERTRDSVAARRLWKRLAVLNAHIAGQSSPAVDESTPGQEAGLEPFMFGLTEAVVTRQSPALLDARMALDGLYACMEHAADISIKSFGPGAKSTVNQFLNYRIEERLAL